MMLPILQIDFEGRSSAVFLQPPAPHFDKYTAEVRFCKDASWFTT